MNKQFQPIFQIIGPFAVCTTLILASNGSSLLQLTLAGSFGLFLCTLFRTKGLLYALALLTILTLFGHLFDPVSHLWRLGLEASLACALFITAQVRELEHFDQAALQDQINTKNAAVSHLEEEMLKMQQELIARSLAISQKNEELEKNLEELQSEKSATEILNDVLRKNNAAHYIEKKALASQLEEAAKQKHCLHLENENLRKEIQEQSQIQNQQEPIKKERDFFKEQLGLAEEKIQDLAAIEAKYQQLKQQFWEKNQILQQTRCDLFQHKLQEDTASIEETEKNLQFDLLSLRLEKDLVKVTEESALLEQENQELQELVACLARTPPPPSPRTTLQEAFSTKKKQILAPGELSLEETLRDALSPKKRKKTAKPPQQDLLF